MHTHGSPRFFAISHPTLSVAALCFVLALGSVASAQLPDRDLPGAGPHFELIPAGSYVIPMDNANQNIGSAFNMKAYGLVNELLHASIPVKWAIAAGKAHDGADFTADASRVYPSAVATASVTFKGGPFIIPASLVPLAAPLITIYGQNVAVYALTDATTIDIRYTLAHRPKIGVLNDGSNAAIHTGILTEAGFIGGAGGDFATIAAVDVASIANTECYTFVSTPHYEPSNVNSATVNSQTAAIRAFVENGGNFLAQCAGVRTYENNVINGRHHSTLGFADDDSATAFSYPNADMAFGQFEGVLNDEGGSLQDWVLAPGSVLRANAFPQVTKSTNVNVFRGGVAKLTAGTPGSVVFYLGGHQYSGSDIDEINGRRMYMNAVFVPPNRPATCLINFLTDLSITKNDGLTTVINGQAITYTMTVTNNGPGATALAPVVDIMPPSLTGVAWTAVGAGGGSAAAAAGSGDINTTVDLPIFGSVTFTVNATIGTATDCLVTNVASVSTPSGQTDADPSNNSATDTDRIIPPFACPPALMVQCASQVPAAATNAAAFTEQGGTVSGSCCGIATTVALLGDSDNGGTGCASDPKIITRTYRATTGCGDTVDCTQTITIKDTTGPVLAGVPANTTADCSGLPAPAMVTATDNCSAAALTVTFSTSTAPGGCTGSYVLTRTWTATDACGNAASSSQIITVSDSVGPTLSGVPAGGELGCNPTLPTAAAPGAVTANDACDGVRPVTCTPGAITGEPCARSQSFVYAASDTCGNPTAATATYTWREDLTPPLINDVPANLALECGEPTPAVGAPTASDACSTATLTYDGETQHGDSCRGYIVRMWTATDACGNTATATQTIDFVDTIPPTVVCPPGIAGSAANGTAVIPDYASLATAADNCGPVTVTQSPVAGTPVLGPPQSVAVVLTATDTCGNTAICSTPYITSNSIATTIDVGGGCGPPGPQLYGTFAELGGFASLGVRGADPTGTLFLFIDLGPFDLPFFRYTCLILINPYESFILGPYGLSSAGEFSFVGYLPDDPALIDFTFGVQALVLAPGGPLNGGAFVSNGVVATVGAGPPFCTHTVGSFAGVGGGGTIYDTHYQTVFASGVTIGQYTPGNGALAPNGLTWTGDAAGRAALKAFLGDALAAPAAFGADAVNPVSATDGGALAQQTAALTLNIGFNAAGFSGAQTDFGDVVYLNCCAGDTLTGYAVGDLLLAANQALAGFPLPAGYTLTSLTLLLADVNASFANCFSTTFAQLHMFNPPPAP